MPCLRGAWIKAVVGDSWEVLLSRSCEIRSRRSRSWPEALGQGLLRRSCGDPSEMLSEAFAWSCTGPCEKLLKRSWWNPLGVLTWSGTGPCEKIFWRSCLIKILEMLCVGAWWCLYESSSGMLIGSSCLKILREPLYIYIYNIYRRSCCCSCLNFKPHLLLLHSCCCLYLVQWFPTLDALWVLLPV